MRTKSVLSVLLLIVTACGSTERKPIVYPGSIRSEAQYRTDLAECENWGERAVSEDPTVAQGGTAGAIGGALIGAAFGAAIGAILGDAGTGAQVGVASGAMEGALGGAASNYSTREDRKKSAVYTCLEARGYRVAR
jgi:outer membrane lipoprotein SlyB